MNNMTKWDAINGTDQSDARKQAFSEAITDCYLVLQLPSTVENRFRIFASYDTLRRSGERPSAQNYEATYAGALPSFTDLNMQLESMYRKFNTDRPVDFHGHSLSVSDVIMLKVNGKVSAHYVDPVGFKELKGFSIADNYLRSAEMTVEDDLGMIDGIINNGKKEPEKASVLK